jgi:hypothetical protein
MGRLGKPAWGLLLSLALLAVPAEAQRLRLTPVPPQVTPQWTPVPEAPQVSYAPNIPTDVFRYKGKYYFYWAGIWYRSKKVKGPYDRLKNLPEIFGQVDARYYKTAPKEEPQVQPPSPVVPPPGPGEGLTSPETQPETPPAVPPGTTTPEETPLAPPDSETGK